MNERQRIGIRISELRKEAGISQSKLSELSGVQVAHIGRIELGRYSVGIDILSKIANALNYKVELVKK